MPSARSPDGKGCLITRESQYLLAGLVVAVNPVVYVALWRRRSEARG